MTPTRDRLIQGFLESAGWGSAQRGKLAGDASFRSYDRLNRDGAPAVMMDAPPPKEDVRPFVAITRHLQTFGYSVPTVMAEDAALGLLLQEGLQRVPLGHRELGEEDLAVIELHVAVGRDAHGVGDCVGEAQLAEDLELFFRAAQVERARRVR